MKKGCVILAGGMGTRLGLKGPKGCLKVWGEQTLFEILLKKTKGPVAIMTSPLNREATEKFLEAHDFFGVKGVTLFDQDLKDGAPDGNGKVFKKLCETGICDLWKKQGVDVIGFLPVDNPLGSIDDLVRYKEELIVRCVKIESPEEKIGRIVERYGTLSIEEYTEMQEKTELGYTGQFACTMEFIERVSHYPTVWHQVIKEGQVRFESFIFDVFPYAQSHRLVVSEREKYFAPIKDQKSLERVQR